MRANWVQDELILALELYIRVGLADENHPEVVELSNFLQSLPLHSHQSRSDGFRSPSSVALKLANLANHDPAFSGRPTHGAKADKEIWDDWANRLSDLSEAAHSLRKVVSKGTHGSTEEPEEDLAIPEGKVLFREHRVRERNKKLRTKKIEEALVSSGSVRCVVCDFDFESVYGERGRGYIECHHIVPLHLLGETQTRLRDLALICSNCHRMIHRSRPWVTPEALREVVKAQASFLNQGDSV